MIHIRRSNERGHADHGWLNTYHTFSFDTYHDPRFMGFRHLRVINEDRVAGGGGFPTHPHRDMEIITYILEGALQHKDSMGNGSIIRPGDVQRMSAGTGVTHSEANASETESVHLLQIWILPERKGITPGYEQTTFDKGELSGRLKLVASGQPKDRAVKIHQDTNLFAAVLAPKERVEHAIPANRHAWLQLARGKAVVNGQMLTAGDGVAATEEPSLTIEAEDNVEFLLFDLA